MATNRSDRFRRKLSMNWSIQFTESLRRNLLGPRSNPDQPRHFFRKDTLPIFFFIHQEIFSGFHIFISIINTSLILISSHIFSRPRMPIQMEFNGVFVSKNWKQILNSNMSANKICVVTNFKTFCSWFMVKIQNTSQIANQQYIFLRITTVSNRSSCYVWNSWNDC